MNSSSLVKAMILILMIIYIISPVDAYPGPLDDLVVLLLGVAARKRIGGAQD